MLSYERYNLSSRVRRGHARLRRSPTGNRILSPDSKGYKLRYRVKPEAERLNYWELRRLR